MGLCPFLRSLTYTLKLVILSRNQIFTNQEILIILHLKTKALWQTG